jgi:exopolysaccharide biosynthesis WecB/TagA/CpsF family protein
MTEPIADSETRQHRRYCLITPCRDEAQYARRTLDSVAEQTLPPSLWVIVDDGSSDDTPRIVEEYAARLPYIRLIRRANRGHRRVGGGVVEAFNVGYAPVAGSEFEYICKLDLDLVLPPGYFEGLVRRMEAEPRLGSTSGKPWFVHPRTGALVPEVCGDEMSVGMTKFYRHSCFKEIGGFVEQVMWDGIDCHRARMLGWIAESVNDEPLRFTHLRPQGASQTSIWTGRVRAGFGQYYMGTAPLYYLASAAYRSFEHPPIVGSLAMLWGYARSAIRRLPRYEDREFRRFLRRYQYACLLRGKHAATARLNARQEPVWRRSHLPTELRPEVAAGAERSELLGLEFERGALEGVAARCLAWTTQPRRSHVVVTANASHVCMTRRDPALFDACRAADMVVADGMSVVWALKALGRPVAERVAGIDLMNTLLEAASAQRLRVYLLGARQEVLDTLVAECKRRYPGLVMAGARNGYFGEADHAPIVEDIRASRPDLLFVGMPSPFKDVFCERHRDRLDVPVIMGVGGSFDVMAGVIARAPKAAQAMGLEWAWRLMKEPGRLWKRYLTTNSEFVWLVLREMWRSRARAVRAPHSNG